MIIVCPRCKASHDIPDGNRSVTLKCSCDEELLIEPRTQSRRVPQKRKMIQCSRCNRIYDPREIQSGKKICHTCGNVIIVKEVDKTAVTRAKGDKQVIYARTEMRALIEMCRLLSSSFQRDTILSEIMRITNDLLCVEGSSIILIDEEKGDMIFHIATGTKSEELKKVRLTFGEGVAGHVLRSRTPLIVNNVKNDSHFSNRVDNKIKFVTRNLLCVPISLGDRIIGVLEAVNKLDRGGFDEFDLRISEAIASQAGLAIEKTRLIQEKINSERLIAIGQTISNLSYCVKNILTTLEGWAYNMDQALKEQDHQNEMVVWAMIRKSISRIGDLINDLLLYSTERDRERQPADINALIEETVEFSRERIEEKQIAVTTKLDRTLRPVSVNSRDFFRCLFGLLANAIEACKTEGGAIEISSKANRDLRYLFLEVHDNGSGIPQDNMDKIFTVFFTTKGMEHSGLGLTIARKIVEEHGGGIVIDSSLGRGTRLIIKLPLLEEEE